MIIIVVTPPMSGKHDDKRESSMHIPEVVAFPNNGVFSFINPVYGEMQSDISQRKIASYALKSASIIEFKLRPIIQNFVSKGS